MTWPAENDARLAELLTYEAEAEGLDQYIRRISPQLPPPPHLKPLIDVWQRTRVEPVRAVIELPPRHAKTTTAMHGFSWRMFLDPALRHAYCTYAEALALEKSRGVRRLSQHAGVELGSEALHHWETTHGGSFTAVGVGGPLTGKGIDGVAVIDDPHKNRAEAESRLIRDKIWDWFTDVLWTRLEDDASVLVVQTRWHKDDLIGRLLKGFEDPATGASVEFERIRLPALAEQFDPLGREEGEALWPSRFPATKLHGIRSIMGAYGFEALYQQNPKTKGDRLFRSEAARFELERWELDGHRVLIICDPAATAKSTADHTAILALAAEGYGENMRVWVLDHFRAQTTIPNVVKVLRRFQSTYWGVAIGVEAVGAFKAIPDMLREEDPTLKVLPIHPLGDKFTRAQPVASAYNEGRVLIPIDRPWARTLIAELEDFTGVSDPEDDQVDALAHGWNTLFSARPPRQRGARRERSLPYG